MYNGMYPSLLYYTKCFHCPKNPLSLAHLSLLSIPTPNRRKTLTFYGLQNVRQLGFIQYMTFSNWLLSLSNMHVRFLYVFLWFDSSFLTFFHLFYFKKLLKSQYTFNIVVYQFQVYSIVVRQSYTLQNALPDISRTQLAPYIVITVLPTILPMLYYCTSP